MKIQTIKIHTVLVAAIALTLSPSTFAAQVKRANNIVEITEGPLTNNVNSVRVGRTADGFIVEDLTTNITVGQGCSRVNSRKAICGNTTPSRVKMKLAGGNDVASIITGAVPAPLDVDAGSGDDKLFGSDRNDTLNGGIGKDTIEGGKGNDTIKGGAGDDKINGGADKDNIDGEAGKDTISGGPGDDTVKGGLGNDTLNGDAGNDKIIGDAGDDSINGGPGQDDINAGLGKDKINVDDNTKDTVQCGIADPAIDTVDTDANFLDNLTNCEDSFVD